MYTTKIYLAFEYLGNSEYETKPYKSSMLISSYARIYSGLVVDENMFKSFQKAIKHDISSRYNLDVEDIHDDDFIILFWGEVKYDG